MKLKHIREIAKWLVDNGFPSEFYFTPTPSFMLMPLAREWEKKSGRTLAEAIVDVYFACPWADHEFPVEEYYEFPIVMLRGSDLVGVVRSNDGDLVQVSLRLAGEPVTLTLFRSDVVEFDRIVFNH